MEMSLAGSSRWGELYCYNASKEGYPRCVGRALGEVKSFDGRRASGSRTPTLQLRQSSGRKIRPR